MHCLLKPNGAAFESPLNLLIAVKSCARDRENGSHAAIRRTWACAVGHIPVRFFTGGEAVLPDEVHLDAPDTYEGLPLKVKEILRWSLANGFDHTLLLDNDTFIISEVLLKCGFEQHDYTGKNAARRKQAPFAHGGWSYFVSRRLAELVVKAEPQTNAEDRFVGQVAADNRIALYTPKDFDSMAFHFPPAAYGRRYHPSLQWQEMMYRKFCLHQEGVPVLYENRLPNAKVTAKPNQVLIRMKGSGKPTPVSEQTARRLLFRGLAERL
jgi:hypothetical protein